MQLVFAVFTAALSLPLVAGAGEQAAPSETKKERLICRNDIVTGSRAQTSRRCLTEAQWREHDEDLKRGDGRARVVRE